MKTEIKNSTEITGFLAVITKIPDSTAPNASTSNSKLFMKKEDSYSDVPSELIELYTPML